MFRLALVFALALSTLSAQDIRTGVWRGQKVTYEVIAGRAIYQGDIDLGPVEELERAAKDPAGEREASGRPQSATRFRWPNRTVPYVISDELPNKQRVTDAIQHWNDVSPLRFVERTTETDYIRFVRVPGTGVCSSAVGRTGGPQNISLDDGCGVGSNIHEIGHAIGLWHEQSRHDRDLYVKVEESNIDKRRLFNFDQEINTGQDFGLYDFGSIMHYGAFDFSRNGQISIRTVPAGIPIGQRAGLSPGDLDGVRRMYDVPSSTTTITTFPAGLQIVVDGETHTAPKAFEWAPGERHTIGVPEVQGAGAIRHVFGRWTDDGAATHAITVNPDIRVYAAAFVRQARLQIAANTPDGEVAATPASPDGYYSDGTVVEVRARPNTGAFFGGWTGTGVTAANAGRNPARVVVRSAELRYAANFTRAPVTVVTSDPIGLQVQVDGATVTTPRVFTWQPGSTHSLNVANPNQQGGGAPARYVFESWADAPEASRTVTAGQESATYTARFQTQYSVMSSNSPFNQGSVRIEPVPEAGSYFAAGSTITLTASPNSSSRFTGWSGDLGGSNNPEIRVVDDQLQITANYAVPRQITTAATLSAATFLTGAIAPGQIVTLFGLEIGPETPGETRLTPAGRIDTTTAETRVLFDGVPGPMLYASRHQVIAVVPFSVGERTSTLVQVEHRGQTSNALRLAVAPAAPGLFTRNATGRGGGAILNQNGSLNGPENPAVKGSVIVLYATGAGLTDPSSIDGALSAAPFPEPRLPVRVFIGNREAGILYAGAAPTLVAGVLQVNARIPDDAPSGNLTVTLQVGDYRSPGVVTVAVQ